jgi:hypothetical protein
MKNYTKNLTNQWNEELAGRVEELPLKITLTEQKKSW